MSVGRHIEIRGIVQGVGFRPWVYRVARTAGLTGSVSNDAAGVIIEAFAPVESDLDAFVANLRTDLPPAARIEALTWAEIPVTEPPGSFDIVESSTAGLRRPSIPADLATCEACALEIADPEDRRYRYPFTSCTHCGPRFTIALDVPYDRATTTMAPFPMCADCLREYGDPADRRFHAQPNACPRCGPSLRLVDANRAPVSDRFPAKRDAIARAATLLARGAILAVKGLGGWHLACDATRPDSVRELRRRKRRDEKPFALMVRDLETAGRLCEIEEAARALLASPAHPIVLLPLRDGAGVAAAAIAPDSKRLGLMLPYTPLHHVLMADIGRPLVMTSGNASDEPIACDDDDAFARLAPIADAFLVHDRVIASRADDSVAVVALGRPVVTRRSRGYVPGRISLSRLLLRPTLACGAQLKNAFCLGDRDGAYFGPHIGDLDNLAAYEGYERAIERLERFLRVRPELIAHDLHPDYLSTRYARARSARDGSACVAVQHHHAHVVSALVENGLEGPVIGVAFDGTGYGTDGTSWGGEILVADVAGFERVASLRCLRLAGGDRAIQQVWRIALAALDDAFEGDPPLDRLALFDAVPPAEIAVVRRMLAAGINAPLASGAGRYFDAVGALGLARPRASFEGQVAMAWEQAAGSSETRSYPFAVDTAQPVWRIDLRPTLRAVVDDLLAGRPASLVAARFHETLIDATADVVRGVVSSRGPMPVVFTGGCFQNVRLAEGLARALRPDLAVYMHQEVPPGDGGIALGQLAIADAVLRNTPIQGGGVPCASASPER
jgi:hydrogenase maturation protein HypF